VRPWYVILLAAVAAAVIIFGVTQLGTSTASTARTSKENVTAEDGVVQTTVSGSGEVEPGVDDTLNFATSGTLQSVNVKVGDHVKKGQLIATLDPSSAELTLEEAQANVTEAEDNLTEVEDGDSTGSSSSGGSSGGSSNSSSSSSSTSSSEPTASVASVVKPSGGRGQGSGKSGGGTTTTAATRTVTVIRTVTATTPKATPSPSAIEEAEVQVKEAEATVTADQKAVDETKLYAPASGMIASLSSDSVGATVSSGSGSSGGGSSSSGSSAASAASDSSSSSSSSTSSGFAELINDKAMTMSVSLSEDDISNVKVGQIATVSITALSGVELAGHVTSISPLGSDSSGVVSYNATLTITQNNSKVLPGMSATATIVTGQAQGVTIQNDAITGSGSNATVELVKGSKVTTQPVVVGLKGSSRSQIVSGLKSGQQVQVTITLPSLGTSSSNSSTTSSSTSLGGGFGGGTGATGGGFAGRGGFRALFGGGGAG
jgi:macrolide-specific efflux system membrane fusion protein